MSKSKADDFVHLHVHSDMSQLDGCGKVADYIKATKDRGAPAIAFTEHGTMRGYYQQLIECNEHKVKPIYGIEFYVAADMGRKGVTAEERADITKGLKRAEAKQAVKDFEERHGIRDRWHITVWAKNAVGLRNLYKLSSIAYTDGFYYKPRIDLKALMDNGEGLAVATGCLSSPINDRIVSGKKRVALEKADLLRERFGEDLWIEIQPHDIRDQVVANKFAMELKDRWGKHARLLATQDAHYVHQADAAAHEVLLCIGTNDRLTNPDRFKFDGSEFYMKTRQQMWDTFKRHHSSIPDHFIKEALDNTLVLNEMVDPKIIEVDRFKCLMPELELPSEYGVGDDAEYAYLKDLCRKGWKWRKITDRANAYAQRHGMNKKEAKAIYVSRLHTELKAIKEQKFIGYFLLVYDVYQFARGRDIACGPGRGSAAGSIVSFLLGITSVDPIEHGLIFERFISPNRVDMPDIDMDFEDVRRHEIIDYLREKYGEDKVCQIATVGKLSGKQCLKDVSRVLEVPYAAVNEVTNSIIERSSGDERASQTIQDSFKEFKVCREFNKRYPDVLKYAKKLEGMAKNLGIHAAGVITSPQPLTELIPLEIRKHEGRDIVVSAIDMYGVAAMGLLKLDVLGLRTLTVLKDCIKAVKDRHGVDIDLEELALNDKKALDGFTEHDYVGIFQYDSPGADKICSGVKFEHFEDIAAMTALNRPGTARSGLATQYVARKKNPALVKETSMHESVSKITADTLGIIVYQEHVLKIFTQVAGFEPGTADSLRKKIAKKWGDETIGKERENFIKGAKNTVDMDPKTAGKIMDAITFFGCLPLDTMVSTPDGAVPIAALQDGDEIWSWDGVNRVANVVKRAACTGCKQLCRIETNKGSTFSSQDHWWLLANSEYKRTRDLAVGDVLSYVTTYEPKNKLFGAKLPQDGVLSRDVQRSLSEVVQGAKDNIRQPGEQHPRPASRNRQRVEGSENQGDLSSNVESIVEDHRPKQSGVEGGPRQEFPEGQTLVDGEYQHLRALRPGSRGQTVPDARAPQGQESEEQCVGESGVDLCELPHGGTQYGAARSSTCGQAEVQWVSACDQSVEMADIEVVSEPHNYILQDGLISHNSYGFNKSHATAYGIIAYWGMWLKKRYPLEFYWALLKNEPARIRIQQIAKDAKKHDIELLPPAVSVSKKHFAIDVTCGAIRGSLVDIKGVGEAAATTIMDNQPYTGLFDFLGRVDRRKCHKGVVLALAKAGALDDMLPNIKWFIENIEDFWKAYNKKPPDAKKLKAMIETSKRVPDYADEERQLLASSVSPLAFGKHPIDAYQDFMSRHVKVAIASMSDDDFFKRHDNKGVYVAGVIVEVKYNQIGDFHTGALPNEDERRKQFWGARYANVNVEDAGGKQNRIKMDIDIFDDFRDVIDSGIGTPVVVHASVNARFENLRGHFIIDLESYRKKIGAKEPLNVWEAVLNEEHPTAVYPWKPGWTEYKTRDGKEHKHKNLANRIHNKAFFDEASEMFVGIVTNVRLKFDKRDNEMAFFGMMAGNGKFIDCICFGSHWTRAAKKVIKAGQHMKIQLDREHSNNRWQYFFNGGKIKLLQKSASHGAST